jgi:hypothetical protein
MLTLLHAACQDPAPCLLTGFARTARIADNAKSVKFARIAFALAGIWGIVVLTPLFFLHDISGRAYPPPADYPHFFYGFLAVAMAWQIAFLIIASDPVRFRLLMIPAILEKFPYVVIAAVLHGRGRISMDDASTAVPDLILGILFVIAFLKTRSRTRQDQR